MKTDCVRRHGAPFERPSWRHLSLSGVPQRPSPGRAARGGTCGTATPSIGWRQKSGRPPATAPTSDGADCRYALSAGLFIAICSRIRSVTVWTRAPGGGPRRAGRAAPGRCRAGRAAPWCALVRDPRAIWLRPWCDPLRSCGRAPWCSPWSARRAAPHRCAPWCLRRRAPPMMAPAPGEISRCANLANQMKRELAGTGPATGSRTSKARAPSAVNARGSNRTGRKAKAVPPIKLKS